jgi:hypothetical protein
LPLAHFAIRALMHEAALQAGEDPDRLSLLHAVRVVRRLVPLHRGFDGLSTAWLQGWQDSAVDLEDDTARQAWPA